MQIEDKYKKIAKDIGGYTVSALTGSLVSVLTEKNFSVYALNDFNTWQTKLTHAAKAQLFDAVSFAAIKNLAYGETSDRAQDLGHLGFIAGSIWKPFAHANIGFAAIGELAGTIYENMTGGYLFIGYENGLAGDHYHNTTFHL